MPAAQIYVDGCDVCLDPCTAHNVRANLVAVDGLTYLLPPGDTRSLGPAPVLDGRECLALPAGSDRVLAELHRLVRHGRTPGQAIAQALPGAGRIAEGTPADWWLVPGGPLADPSALRRPRHIVKGGVRVGGD